MKLAELSWPDVAALSREVVVVIPTGSIEQHGAHLPLFTDTILATAVAEAAERELGARVLLTPTIWLGASAHHLPFAGTLSASMTGYVEQVTAIVTSLVPHGFWKFFLVNGHGGNTSLNDVALRTLKSLHPNLVLGALGYFEFCDCSCLDGPIKGIRHACEAETSLMMHVAPGLVRADKLRDDGLESSVKGLTHNFDEITEAGSFGFATLGDAAKGKLLFDGAVEGLARNLNLIYENEPLRGVFD